ncbi:MAG: hypothetical protein R3B09_06670 [Nannocystaceae bacterium]
MYNPKGGGPFMIGDFEVDPGAFLDILVVKFSSEAHPLWEKHITGPDYHYLKALRACGDGVVLAGSAPPLSLDLGGGLLSDEDFIVRFDSDGSHIWSRSIPVSANDGELTVTEMACNSCGSLALTGYYRAGVDFGGGMMAPAMTNDGFIASYDAIGQLKWARGFGSVDGYPVSGYALAVTPDEDIVMAGTFAGSIDLGEVFASPGKRDAIVSLFGEGGLPIWSRQIGGAGDKYGTAVAVRSDGAVSVGGIFSDEILLGEEHYYNVFPDAPLDQYGFLHDGFIATFSPEGVLASSVHVASLLDDQMHRLAYDSKDVLVMAGRESENYVLRTYPQGMPGWTWSSDQLGGGQIHMALADNAFIVGASVEGPVDLGGGPIDSFGNGDFLIARVPR